MAKKLKQAIPGIDTYIPLRAAARQLRIGEERLISIIKKYQVPVLVLKDERDQELKRIRTVDLQNLLDKNMYGML